MFLLKDELVGVAFLNLDPLLHLLDVDDCVKIVNFNGDANGFIKLAVRSWIDKVFTLYNETICERSY